MPSPGLRRAALGEELAEVLPRVDLDVAAEPSQTTCGRATDAPGELVPAAVRGHDHQRPLLFPVIEDLVDPVARPGRGGVLRAEVVEDDDLEPARRGRRLA